VFKTRSIHSFVSAFAASYSAHADRCGIVQVTFCRALPLGPIWDEFCKRRNTPAGFGLMAEIQACETAVLAKR